MILWLFIASSSYGQAVGIDKWTPSFPTAGERKAADIASWVTVLTDVALDTRASWQSEDRRRAFLLQGVRIGVTYGAAFPVKKLIRRQRPCAPSCGTDDPSQSFYSAHTALACSTLGGPRMAFSLSLAGGTGGLRVGADKHWLTDILAGCAAGLATSRIR